MATYDTIATSTLGSAQQTFTFNNIPQTYTDLIVIVDGLSSGGVDNFCMRFNNDSSSVYGGTLCEGNGSSQTGYRTWNSSNIVTALFYSSVSSTYRSIAKFEINNYTSTNMHKNVIVRSNAPGTGDKVGAGVWRPSTPVAITRIDVFNGTLNFTAGTTCTIWGIKAA